MLHAMTRVHRSIRTIIVWCEGLADHVQAVQLMKDVEPNNVMIRVAGNAGCGVGQSAGFLGRDPAYADFCYASVIGKME
jgi:hypothetical protein